MTYSKYGKYAAKRIFVKTVSTLSSVAGMFSVLLVCMISDRVIEKVSDILTNVDKKIYNIGEDERTKRKTQNKD